MYSFKGRRNNKNHAFLSKRCTSNEIHVIVIHFTMKIIHTYLYITCNFFFFFFFFFFLENILAYFGYSPTSTFFLLLSEHKHAITRQLIRTARTLEAEWWQACGETWVRGQRKMNQVLGAFGLLDFTMLRPFLAWHAFWNLRTVYFFNPLNAELNPICHSRILLGDLTFMGPCIVSIFQYIFNKMQRYTLYLYLETVGTGLSVLWVAYATHSTLKPVPTLPR